MFVTISEYAREHKVSRPLVYRLVEEGKLHLIEVKDRNGTIEKKIDIDEKLPAGIRRFGKRMRKTV